MLLTIWPFLSPEKAVLTRHAHKSGLYDYASRERMLAGVARSRWHCGKDTIWGIGEVSLFKLVSQVNNANGQ